MSYPCKEWVDALAPPITASYSIPVLLLVLWFVSDWEGSRSPYVHPARNWGDCWDVCEAVSLRNSGYPPEQAGWRMQLRFRGAQVPGDRCWQWVSASKRTDHKCQWPWTLGTHTIWTSLTRQGKGHLVTPARTQSRTATSSHCHEDISPTSRYHLLKEDAKEQTLKKEEEEKSSPYRGFQLIIRHNIYENKADTEWRCSFSMNDKSLIGGIWK